MKYDKTFVAAKQLLLALLLAALIFLPVLTKASSINADTAITVPIGGNGWRTDKDTIGGNISTHGIVNWSQKSAEFVTYVRFAKKGKVKVWLNLTVPKGESILSVTALKETREVLVREKTKGSLRSGMGC